MVNICGMAGELDIACCLVKFSVVLSSSAALQVAVISDMEKRTAGPMPRSRSLHLTNHYDRCRHLNTAMLQQRYTLRL